MIYHLTRDELADHPIGATITLRGKELQVHDPVAAARRLFAGGETVVVPVLDGERYVGSVDRTSLSAGIADDAPVGDVAVADLVPVATESTAAGEALDTLDRHGGRRLVVVGGDGSTYVGLVCLRSDRVRLCVDASRLEL